MKILSELEKMEKFSFLMESTFIKHRLFNVAKRQFKGDEKVPSIFLE